MKRKSKKYLEQEKMIIKNKLYSPHDAFSLLKQMGSNNFDTSVDVAIKLNIDPKKVQHQLRGALVLPHGTGKSKTVLVLAKGEQAVAAREAGADYVGDNDYLEKIEQEKWLNFEVLIATPEMMPSLSKLGKILGPKGLMPNPKTGTVTNDVKKIVSEVKKGRIEYRSDSYGNVHVVIGKSSFDEEKLLSNFNYLIENIIKLKPADVKGIYLQKVVISNTMSPGIKIDLTSFDK